MKVQRGRIHELRVLGVLNLRVEGLNIYICDWDLEFEGSRVVWFLVFRVFGFWSFQGVIKGSLDCNDRVQGLMIMFRVEGIERGFGMGQFEVKTGNVGTNILYEIQRRISQHFHSFF